jgi:hypothetical protein
MGPHVYLESEDDTAVLAVDEPQHEGHLEASREHGSLWVTCGQCGRQWAIHGARAEQVSDGDGYCDDNARE